MKRLNTGWIIGIGLVVAIALAAVVAIVLSGDDSTTVKAGLEQTRPITISGTGLPTLTDGGTDPSVGMTAPVLTGATFDGSAATTAGASPRLLLFVAHWCPHCQREVPLLVDWAERGGVPNGVKIVVVSTGVDAKAPNYPPSAWLAKERVAWPVIVDDEKRSGASAMGLSGFPYFVLLRADGTVAWRGSGELDPAALTQQITTLLGA
ncbi:MAG: TlpA disulfide reductase family protein [Ilumatobacteraceae bacterium]